jgi:hypothetical protein
MKFTPRGEFPRQRPLLASPLVLLSGEELIITEFPRQRPLLASPLVLLSGEQLGFCGRGRYLIPTPGVIFDALGLDIQFLAKGYPLSGTREIDIRL